MFYKTNALKTSLKVNNGDLIIYINFLKQKTFQKFRLCRLAQPFKKKCGLDLDSQDSLYLKFS